MVAAHTSLSLAWSQTPEDRFSCDVAQLFLEELLKKFFFLFWTFVILNLSL